MPNLTVTLETVEAQEIHGVWGKSSDRTVSKDIPRLSAEYYRAVGKKRGRSCPFMSSPRITTRGRRRSSF